MTQIEQYKRTIIKIKIKLILLASVGISILSIAKHIAFEVEYIRRLKQYNNAGRKYNLRRVRVPLRFRTAGHLVFFNGMRVVTYV